MSEELQVAEAKTLPSIKDALAVLFQSGAESLQELDAEIAGKKAELERIVADRTGEIKSLQHARYVIALRFDPQAVNPNAPRRGGPRKKGEKVAKPDGPRLAPVSAEKPPVSFGMMPERRRAIAKLLGKRGPMFPQKIAEECGIPTGSITSVLDCPYFNRTESGVRLTELGRKELLPTED
jgi:hypothetical protein